jgi:hypothetical protein
MSIKVGLIVAAHVNWWILSAASVGAVMLIWFVVRNQPWRWARLELIGYGTWALAGAMFAVPEIWASRDNDLPFPTLSGTIGHLERRWDIVALLVILVVTYALLQVIRVGAAVVATRVGLAEASHLVLYPYPSIIAWFVDLKNVHDHCAQHGTELICTGK